MKKRQLEKRTMTSNFEETIEELLEEAFPRCTIFPQHPVKFEGDQLFIDFFIPSMNLAIECQGEQHYKFVPHFHGNEAGFTSYVSRDSVKKRWAQKNKVKLIEIPYNAVPETATELFHLIYEQAKK
jgi:hypothetical protein